MGRLTYENQYGEWGLKGIQWEELHEGKTISKDMQWAIFGVLGKLKDYEDTGLEPDEVERLTADSDQDAGNWNVEKAIFELQERIVLCERYGLKYQIPMYYEALKVAIAALKAQLAVKQNGWIPVEEPPKEAGFYLVCLSERVTGEQDMRIVKAWWSENHNAFLEYGCTVVAWQPLPEPYKAEKG